MMEPDIKRAGFSFRLRTGVVTRLKVRGDVAVMLSGGDRIITHADRRIHQRGGGPVVDPLCGDGISYVTLPNPNIPDRLYRTVKQTRLFAVRQACFPPLCDNFTRRVGMLKPELKVTIL